MSPADDDLVDDALREEPGQRFVGRRDLTHWPSAVGRLLARWAAAAAHAIGADRVLALTLLIGLVVVGALTAVVAALYDAVTESEGVAGLDRPVLDAMISIRNPTANRLITGYTHLGSTVGMTLIATTIAVVCAVAWRQWSPVVLIAITGAGSATLVTVGKVVVGRTRPPLADAVPPYEHTFSFPSGHSLTSMAIAGIVAYLLVRRQDARWLRVTTGAVAALLAVLMGLSRVYLGHHWLTDVLCGWVLGLAWLTVVITAHRLFLTVGGRRQKTVPP